MPHRYDITDELVIDLYFNKGMNRRQTAEYLKCSEDLILYRLKKNNLKPKNMAECVFNSKKRNISLDNIYDILNGEMLGDGHLHKSYKQADFRESFGFDKKEWAIYLFDMFVKNNISMCGNKIYKKAPSGKSKNITWGFSTLKAVELGELHNKWYKKNDEYDLNKKQSFNNRKYIKIVPNDLILKPKALLHWFIGDGSMYERSGAVFYTQGFTWNEVEFLRYRLKEDVGLYSVHYKSNIIYLPKREYFKLLEIIGQCPVECYKYKWKEFKLKQEFKVINSMNIDMKAIEEYYK
jgi:hypothetical protein